jgi:putative membrane protein
MKKLKMLSLALLAGFGTLSLQSCNGSGGGDKGAVADTAQSDPTNDSINNSNTLTAETKLEDDGRMFIDKAASGGMMEVELGKLAQANAQSQRVKNFGAMMVRDHSKANEELKTLATKMNVTLPTTLAAEHQQHVDAMIKMKGADFDKHYMAMMAEDHVKDVDLFQKTANSVRDAEVQQFAAKTLPVLKMHLDSAKAINSALK